MKELSEEIKLAILSCAPYLEEINPMVVKKMVNMVISVLVRNELLTPDQGIESRIPYANKRLILDEPWGNFWDLLNSNKTEKKTKTFTISSFQPSFPELEVDSFSGFFEEHIDFTNSFPVPGMNREEEE